MTQISARLDEAAQHLSAARRERRLLDRLPESCRPVTDDEAVAVQLRTVELLDETIGGWKCSLPKTEGLFIAPILASTIRTSSPCPITLHGGAAKVEPEIAFVIGRDLVPREKPYSESEVRDAIGETHVVLELLGSRYPEPRSLPFSEFLADCLYNQGLFLGPAVDKGLERNLDRLMIRVSSPSGPLVEHEGRHPNGHPINPLVWLANFLSSQGLALKAGQVVTTGSYAGIQEVPVATPLTVEFGDAGSLSVQFVI